jgi:predicted metal-dependent enzyme (double-stranded beta helix superfamily)
VIPSALRFIDAVRDVHRGEPDLPARWKAVEPLLRQLLQEPELHAASRGWPVSHDRTNRRYTNLLFYEDPEFGFVVNGLVKDHSGDTAVHDHGDSWVLYGLLEGNEVVTSYERVDDGSVAGRADLAQTAEVHLAAGDVDVVPPRRAHKERALNRRTVAVIVRSANVGELLRGRYDLARGTVELSPGPEQVPYPLD